MMTDFIINDLKANFGNKAEISRSELHVFFQKFYPDMKDTTFRWKIYDLKQKKIIQPVTKETFSLHYKPEFQPNHSRSAKKLYRLVKNDFPAVEVLVWSTDIINEFMLHQPVRYYTIIEIAKEANEYVFNRLKDQGIKMYSYNPMKKSFNGMYRTPTIR